MRRWRGMLLAAAAAVIVALTGPSLAAGAAVQARQADGFVDSIGVAVHTPFDDTPYVSAFGTVLDRLEELGVRHVRDDLHPGRPDQYARLEALAAAGIGSTLVLGSPNGGASELESLLAVAAGLDGVEALEGPNEFSTMGGDPEWVAHLRTYQHQLYEGANDEPELAGLPVIGPSIVHGDQDELGDVSADLDFGNIHSYPQGEPPDKLGSAITRAAFNSGSKPLWATETGYNTALASEAENRPVSEAAMATYVPRLFLEYWRWGIARTFSYELLDEFPDPEGDDAESNFGLLRNDLSPKPAFEALRNTIAILEDPGPAFSPAALDYTLSEAGVAFEGPESPALHKVLVQKRDGSFYLAMWRTTSVWDPDAGEPSAAAASPVEVEAGMGLSSVAIYQPNLSAAPSSVIVAPIEPITVEVGAAVTILRLSPADPAEPPTPNPPQRPQPPEEPPPPPRECVVPKLKGRSVGGARTAAKAGHCRLASVRGKWGRASRVVRQWPRPGRVLAPGASLTVKIGPR